MAVSIYNLDMPGMEPFVRGLSRFADRISDWRPFWDAYFRAAWYRHVAAHYASQGSSTGSPWPPLSELYALWKQKHYPGQPIGVLTSALRGSLTIETDPQAIWRAAPTSLEVGTRVPYGLFQQLGTKRRGAGANLRKVSGYKYGKAGGGMPPRPPLRINDVFANLVGRLMQEYAVKTLREHVAATGWKFTMDGGSA